MDTEKLYKKIQTLNEILWDNRALRPLIVEWLKNFEEEEEREEALFLLSKCMYFGHSSIRAILRALYRDIFRSTVIQEIREDFGGTMDGEIIECEYKKRLCRTRFLGVGNPSESGVHLLYYFRQENKIPRKLFINTDELFVTDCVDEVRLSAKHKDVDRIVFIDDLCGSGSQATGNYGVRPCVEKLRTLKNAPKISYLMMFGTTDGIEVVRNATVKNSEVKLFDEVEAVMEMNKSYKCFDERSRYFKEEEQGLREKTRVMAYKYGKVLIDNIIDRDYLRKPNEEKRAELIEHRALGFGDCQLLLSMQHNTPNNTLPIIWFDEDDTVWTPIFKRYNKVY
jgi:hypothetical protein